ncbi:MAG: HPr family phosphocarrier protein [Eubacteriales bacterium]|nr:HPr family phosphocarrier protein [Eubacteriales bacterium]
MVTQSVSIDSLKKIQTLVGILNNYSGRFELISGSSCVNAKSVMGIFSLDISRPVCLNIYNEECASDVLKELASHII